MKLLAASTVTKSSSLIRLCWKQGKQDFAWDSKNFREIWMIGANFHNVFSLNLLYQKRYV